VRARAAASARHTVLLPRIAPSHMLAHTELAIRKPFRQAARP